GRPGFGPGFDSRGLRAKNAVTRIVAKKLTKPGTGKVGLGLRTGTESWYAAWFTGQSVGIGKWVDSQMMLLQDKPLPKAIDDYFEFSFKVEDDLLTVELDGQEVLRVRDTTYAAAGGASFTAYESSAIFKKAEFKI